MWINKLIPKTYEPIGDNQYDRQIAIYDYYHRFLDTAESNLEAEEYDWSEDEANLSAEINLEAEIPSAELVEKDYSIWLKADNIHKASLVFRKYLEPVVPWYGRPGRGREFCGLPPAFIRDVLGFRTPKYGAESPGCRRYHIFIEPVGDYFRVRLSEKEKLYKTRVHVLDEISLIKPKLEPDWASKIAEAP